MTVLEVNDWSVFLGISLVTVISVSPHVYGVLADCNVLHEFLSDVDIHNNCHISDICDVYCLDYYNFYDAHMSLIPLTVCPRRP